MRTVTAPLSKTALLLIAVLSLLAATAGGVGAGPPEHAQNEHAGETVPPEHAQNEHAGETVPPPHAQNERAGDAVPPAHAQNDQEGETGPPPHARNDAAEKVTLCHATGSETNPFVETTVSVNAVTSEGHSSHQDGRDIIPPFEGFAGQNWDAEGQAIHADACASDAGRDDRDNARVTLCHATGSETNPFVVITVSVNAVTSEGHSSHQDGRDIIPPFGGFAGQNWDAEGQALFAGGCVLDDDGEDETVEDVDETVVEGDEVVNVLGSDVELVPEQPMARTVVQPTVEAATVADDTAVLGATVTRGALARTGSSSVAMLAPSGLALVLLGFALRRSARPAAAR